MEHTALLGGNAMTHLFLLYDDIHELVTNNLTYCMVVLTCPYSHHSGVALCKDINSRKMPI